MKKGTSLDIIDSNLRCLSEAGIAVNLFCIVGYPSESADEMVQTLKFICDRINLLRRPGFSCSFSEFILDPWSPMGSAPFRRSNATDDTAERTALMMRRMCNSVVNDLALPLEMVGWEEHSLIMTVCNAKVNSNKRLSSAYIEERMQEEDVSLIATPWLELSGDRAMAKRNRVLIVCQHNARMMWCSPQVPSLLRRFQNPRMLSDLYCEMGAAYSKQLTQLIRSLSLLWKNGFLTEV